MKTPLLKCLKVDHLSQGPTHTIRSSQASTKRTKIWKAWACRWLIKSSMQSGKSDGMLTNKLIRSFWTINHQLIRKSRKKMRCMVTQKTHLINTATIWSKCWKIIIWLGNTKVLTAFTHSFNTDQISSLSFSHAHHISWTRSSIISPIWRIFLKRFCSKWSKESKISCQSS